MKSAGIALVALLMGVLASSVWHSMKFSFTAVRVIDRQDCSDPQYYLEMISQTISVRGEQIGQTDTQSMAATTEAFIYVPRIPLSEDDVRYRLRAHYSDCADVLSDERVVREGSILYEVIEKNGSISHYVRSR